MFYKISDFEINWKIESDLTIKTFSNLTDESLDFKIHPKIRSIGVLVWHIVRAIPEMMNNVGINIDAVKEDDPIPKSVKNICDIYKSASDEMLQKILAAWKDENLFDVITLYGEKWERGFVLQVLLFHQIHHRAQLTVLMRQADLIVQGTYGPTLEEWAEIEMPPQE